MFTYGGCNIQIDEWNCSNQREWVGGAYVRDIRSYNVESLHVGMPQTVIGTPAASRKTKIQLVMLFKIINDLVDIPPSNYLGIPTCSDSTLYERCSQILRVLAPINVSRIYTWAN
jgi:hypothetical protein